jgi:methionyl-tRNA formyltransferase
MKIVFMGTPQFAIPSLSKLTQSQHRLEAVVTIPDKPQGRGQKLSESPVKNFAAGLGLKVLTPENLNEENFIRSLREINPDLIAVVAFRILPEEIFSLPPLGTINLHASLLPKFRGAAPINWAIINGETKTGLTTFYIRKKVDTGDMILQREIVIGPDETFGELSERMANFGAEMLIETIHQVEKGEVQLLKQDDSLASRAPKITPEHCRIDWSADARRIKNLIRGLSPHPGAYALFRGRILKIYKADAVGEVIHTGNFGEVGESDIPDSVLIRTGRGLIKLLEVQPESKKKMSADEFQRGYRVKPGERFE